MMTDGDVSPRDHVPSPDADRLSDQPEETAVDSLAGHVAVGELLRLQAAEPRRSPLARLFGLTPLTATTQQLYRGVVGAMEVGEALDRLGDEWLVLHALPVDSDADDIDHLVIGPSGVHIVSTCNHTGLNVWASQRTFIVAGVRYPYIRDMEYEMGRAERLLSAAVGSSVEVSGILAVVAPKSLVVRDRQRDVAVLQSSNLVAWLGRHKRTLSPAEVTRVADAASLASTWSEPSSPPVPTPEHQREQFEALRAEVEGAWRVQLGWAVGVSVAAVGTFAGITYSILVSAIGSFGL